MPLSSLSSLESWDIPGPGVMDISGYLDGSAAADVEEDALLCIRTGTNALILDCAGMTFLSASGAQSMLRIARAMQKAGGRLAVCNLQLQAREMFEACGLANFIPVYDDRTDAGNALEL